MRILKLELQFLSLLSIFFLLGLSGCGSSTSVQRSENFVKYAKVFVDNSIEVSGRLINLNEDGISIIVEGALVEFDHDNIKSYEIYMAPDPHKMQQDVVISSRAAANNTGFFVVLTIISLVLAGVSGVL